MSDSIKAKFAVQKIELVTNPAGMGASGGRIQVTASEPAEPNQPAGPQFIWQFADPAAANFFIVGEVVELTFTKPAA